MSVTEKKKIHFFVGYSVVSTIFLFIILAQNNGEKNMDYRVYY